MKARLLFGHVRDAPGIVAGLTGLDPGPRHASTRARIRV